MLDQIVIAVCGMSSVWLSQSPVYRSRRWACVIGLVAQPFWMHATFIAEQWGIFALSFVYAAGWMRGINNYWINQVPEGTQP
jgi:hypothetical protein